jgi:hypothetical protein
MALLYCGGSASDAFGALIASGILGVLDGKLGFMAWRFEPNCACAESQTVLIMLLQVALLCGGCFDYRGRGVCDMDYTRFSFNAECLAVA